MHLASRVSVACLANLLARIRRLLLGGERRKNGKICTNETREWLAQARGCNSLNGLAWMDAKCVAKQEFSSRGHFNAVRRVSVKSCLVSR